MTAPGRDEGKPRDDRQFEQWIRQQVEAMLGRDEAHAWLSTPNSHLDGRSPRELLEMGDGERVRAYVVSLLDATFL